MFLHHTYTTSEKFGPTFSCSFFSLSLQLSAVQIDTEDVTVHNIHKLPAYQGWEDGWEEGGRASPFSPVMKLSPQENNNVHDVDSSSAFSRGRSFGNVRQVASPYPTFRPLLSDFFFFSQWGKI